MEIFRDSRTVECLDCWKGSKQQRRVKLESIQEMKSTVPRTQHRSFRIQNCWLPFCLQLYLRLSQYVLCSMSAKHRTIWGQTAFISSFCQLISSHIIPDPLYFKEVNSRSARKSWMKQLSSCSKSNYSSFDLGDSAPASKTRHPVQNNSNTFARSVKSSSTPRVRIHTCELCILHPLPTTQLKKFKIKTNTRLQHIDLCHILPWKYSCRDVSRTTEYTAP